MQIITPWKSSLAVVNVKDQIDLEALATEVLALHCLTHNDDRMPHKVDDTTPLIQKVRDEILPPLVQKFLLDAMDFTLTDWRVDTFGKWFKPGQELGAHWHGDSSITTILYPHDSNATLLAYDPRGNACRGYPRQIRDNHFGNFDFRPKAGDVLIVPSYIQHSVQTVPDKEEMRLSLINDFHITQG